MEYVDILTYGGIIMACLGCVLVSYPYRDCKRRFKHTLNEKSLESKFEKK
jgi:hypothetical protein